MLTQRRRRWSIITSPLGQCIVLSGVPGAGMLKRHQHNAAFRKHGTITQRCFNDGPATKTAGQHWNSIGWMPRFCAKSATYISDWTEIWWVGLHPFYELQRRRVLNDCWPAPAILVEGIHVEDIFELVSFVLPLIISWIFRILAHEEDQNTNFCL